MYIDAVLTPWSIALFCFQSKSFPMSIDVWVFVIAHFVMNF